MDNGNKPAMPSDTFRFLCDINLEQCNVGLTKREHFAAMAMQGILSNSAMIDNVNEKALKWVSMEATQVADALLKALEANDG